MLLHVWNVKANVGELSEDDVKALYEAGWEFVNQSVVRALKPRVRKNFVGLTINHAVQIARADLHFIRPKLDIGEMWGDEDIVDKYSKYTYIVEDEHGKRHTYKHLANATRAKKYKYRNATLWRKRIAELEKVD